MSTICKLQMYTLVISSYWYIMHIVLLLLGVKPSIFFIFITVLRHPVSHGHLEPGDNTSVEASFWIEQPPLLRHLNQKKEL